VTFLEVVIAWAIAKALDKAAIKFGPTSPPARSNPPARVPPLARRPRPTLVPSQPTQATSTPPWPQVVPSGLPAFPGPGWTPDEPPPPAVGTRAHQLLPSLWTAGPGTFKVEQTAGRWIADRATPMGEKKGVVAYRESAHPALRAQPSPAGRPVVTPEGPTLTASVRPPSPAAPPAVARPSVSTALPTLRRGSKGEDVRIAQRALGVTADGDFGPATEAATRAYQRSRGLTPDGIIGPQTWGALLGKAA
jgi:hypothetical protein